MRIPPGPSGLPTLSASQFRTYGAAGFQLDDQEDDQGCPRLYYAKYGTDERLPDGEPAYELLYGSMFHRVLFEMEEHGWDPDTALEKAWDVRLPFSAFEEARHDLQRYLERGSTPRDRYATLAVEVELEGTLFVDKKAGPVRYRGYIDWIGVDPEMPNVLHIVDYKTNRSPFKNDALLGDVQMRGYHWLVQQNVSRFVPAGPASIVTHLDAVKFREVEVRYTDAQIDDWRSWATAVGLAILADEKHEPTINTYCPRCPIRADCPAFQGLPESGSGLAAARDLIEDDEALVDWRERANRVRLVLEKSVKAIDDAFKARAEAEQGLAVGQWVWERQLDVQTVIDLRALHEALGDRFYSAVSSSKAAIERVTKDADPSVLAAAQRAVSDMAVGTKIVRKKAPR